MGGKRWRAQRGETFDGSFLINRTSSQVRRNEKATCLQADGRNKKEKKRQNTDEEMERKGGENRDERRRRRK